MYHRHCIGRDDRRVMRLSKNWLVSRLMTFYVEFFRNIPVLIVDHSGHGFDDRTAAKTE